jgi:hypothetical protein
MREFFVVAELEGGNLTEGRGYITPPGGALIAI